ncbi:MAG: hypothetical protein ACTSVG_01305 [Alphaproteobacteria bacterium]
MSGRRVVQRSRGGGGRMTSVMAVAMLGAVELVIIVVLVVVPILSEGSVPIWNMTLCAILLPAVSVVFMVMSFVKIDGKWQWRWGRARG